MEKIVATRTGFSISKVITEVKGKAITFKRGKGLVRVVKFLTDIPNAEDIWFSIYVQDDCPESWPVEGSRVRSMEFSKKVNGKYTNYKITKILYDKTEMESDVQVGPERKEDPCKTEDTSVSSHKKTEAVFSKTAETVFSKNSPIWFCVSYAKDIVMATANKDKDTAVSLMDRAVNLGAQMYLDILFGWLKVPQLFLFVQPYNYNYRY